MNALSRTWSLWILRGVASLLFGVLTILHPGASVAAIVLVYATFALAEGGLLFGFGLRQPGAKAPFIVRGLVSVAAGVVALVYPGPTALAFYVMVGVWALAAGAAELGIAVVARGEGARVGGLVIAGLLSLACGVALLALPAVGIVALIGFVAGYAISNGIALIVIGLEVHHVARDVEQAV